MLIKFKILITAQPLVKEVIDQLSELCHRDVRSIRTCPECFEYWANDPNDYFTKVCAKPHLIVYAKAEGHKFWPAKVMSVNGNLVNVEFFGEHSQADVPAKLCILYPKRRPVESKKSTPIMVALRVRPILLLSFEIISISFFKYN